MNLLNQFRQSVCSLLNNICKKKTKSFINKGGQTFIMRGGMYHQVMPCLGAENRIKRLVQVPGSERPLLVLNVESNIWVLSLA